MKKTLNTLAISLSLLSFSLSAQAAPFDPSDPDDPRVDTAVRCFMDTEVVRFTSEANIVAPFESTTLSWQVNVPSNCPMQLSIAGQRVNSSGTLSVTPFRSENEYQIVGTILGGRGNLSSVPVNVDTSACSTLPLGEDAVAAQVSNVLAEFDAGSGDVEIIGTPDIQVEATGLKVQTVLDVEVPAFPNPTVTLDMGFRFVVKDGVIGPRYTLFKPDADTILPDDIVQNEFYDRSDDILETFKQALNERVAPLVPSGMQLFEIKTVPDELQVTTCPINNINRRPILDVPILNRPLERSPMRRIQQLR